MSKHFDGRDLVIMTGTTGTMAKVAGSRDCSVTVEGSVTERVQANGARRYKGDVHGWSFAANGLYTVGNSGELCTALLEGTLLYVGAVVGDEIWTGRGYVTAWNAQGQTKGKVTYNVTIVGSGALTINENE